MEVASELNKDDWGIAANEFLMCQQHRNFFMWLNQSSSGMQITLDSIFIILTENKGSEK